MQAAPKPRKCSQCGVAFQPPGRFVFRCNGCHFQHRKASTLSTQYEASGRGRQRPGGQRGS